MKRMKSQFTLGRMAPPALLLLGFVLLISSGLWLPFLARLTQQTAFLSAALAMPEGSLAALEERFKSEIHIVTREGTPQEPGIPSPPPESIDPDPVPESSSRAPVVLPHIPESRRRPVLTEDMSGRGNPNFLRHGHALLRNDTKYSFSKIQAILAPPMELMLDHTDAPQVLIIHTHATEAFTPFDMDVYDTEYTWRSTDHTENVIAVGAALTEAIEAHGIGVVQDKTLHDYPSYNGSYARSALTIQSYLEKYPSIRVVLDVHRDAIERDNEVIVKPTITIDGQKAAQVMVIACADDGSLGIPNWERNLRFAAALTSEVSEHYPGLMRPIFFCHRKYNQHLTDGSLLLEFGTHASTIEEAVYSAELTGDVIGRMLAATLPVK